MSRINEEQWGEFLAELNARNAAVPPPATPQEPDNQVTPMTPTAQIAAIRQRAEQATPGNWSHEPHGDTTALYSGRGGDVFLSNHGLRLMNLDDGDKDFIANADFIAQAREDIPFLLKQIDARESALRALVAQWRSDADALKSFIDRYCEDNEWEDEAAAKAERKATQEHADALERLLESEQ